MSVILVLMRIVLSLLLGYSCFAETRDASVLLREVADSVRSARSWRIEGSIEESGGGIRALPASFILLTHSPNEVRFEQTGGLTPALIVCDAANSWVYSPPLLRYQRVTPPQNSLCSPILGDWESLPATLRSPVLAEYRPIIVGGRTFPCQLVGGFSEPGLPSAGRLKLTLCIDTSRKLIVWEKVESRYGSRAYIYSRLDRDADMPPAAFVFEPPSGSTPTQYDLPVPHPFGAMQMPLQAGVSMPQLLYKQDPNYDEASRKARIEGTVVLYVVIDTNGIPADVEVFRSVTAGLDAEAVRCVRQWRFRPGIKDTQPVTVATLVEMNFRISF